jgi:long-chain acyl-CoA synthetase
VPGTEFQIAPDKEILTKGRHVFLGYYKNDAETAKVLIDGWLHSGDLGEFDEKGCLRILGRKRDVMKTSGGKMVAPMPIEERLKSFDLISQACIVGDGRKYFSVLITLSEHTLNSLRSQGKIKAGVKNDGVVHDQEILSVIESNIHELNKTLASFEQIKKFTVLSREFTIADGEMTPTLKVKRNVIEARFKDLIEKMYEAHS